MRRFFTGCLEECLNHPAITGLVIGMTILYVVAFFTGQLKF